MVAVPAETRAPEVPRRARGRRARRQRVLARFGSTRLEARDPLRRPRREWPGVAARALLLALAAFGLHVLVVVGFFGAGELEPSTVAPPAPSSERVELRIVEPEPEREASRDPAAPEKRRAPVVERVEPPPPDPIDMEPTAPEAPQPRRRIVGLSFESTVTGGSGPLFAVGNTRMGSTERVASDPESADELVARSLNRAATRIPGSRLTKPKRLAEVEPVYPELLRAQGIEADVVVTVAITDTGRVASVEVVRGARPEFDAAALEAARRQRFAPATRDGQPVAYTLTFTYRFRLDEV